MVAERHTGTKSWTLSDSPDKNNNINILIIIIIIIIIIIVIIIIDTCTILCTIQKPKNSISA